jgi:phosphoglycerol transferase MdoB-like AlkP superfamily enzyme
LRHGCFWNKLDLPVLPNRSCFSLCLFLALITVIIKLIQPSKFSRALIGFITAWVLFYFAVFSLAWITIFILDINGSTSGFDLTFKLYNRFMPVTMPTFILFVLLIFYYLSHALKSPALSKKRRRLYVFGLLILPLFVMPVYYFRFIRNDEPTSTTA